MYFLLVVGNFLLAVGIVVLAILAFRFRKLTRREIEVAGICNICHEKYIGPALDCRCTNYGR